MTGIKPLIVIWVVIMALLGISAGVEVLVPGRAAHAFSLVAAAAMAGLVMTWWMDLRSEGGLIRVFSLGALLWFSFMLFITLMDFIAGNTRT